MEPFSIYNALNESLGMYHYWLHVFTAPAEKTLTFILENAAKMLQSSIYMFNSFYSVIGKALFPGCGADDDTVLINQEHLSAEDVQKIQDNPNIMLLPIEFGVSIYAYVFIFKTDQNHRLISLLADLFIEVLSEYLSVEISSKMSQSIQLEQFINDANELKIRSKKELRHCLSQLEIHPYTKTFCVLIQPHNKNNTSIPLIHIISELNALFPSGRFCIYRGSIVGIVGSNNSEFSNYDSHNLNTLMLQYGVDVGISNGINNPSKHLEFFNVIYTMAKAALQFGTVFSNSHSQRVFYYENYRLYHMVDLCKEGFKSRYHHDNFIYLCHPAIIKLYNYDKKNNTDYFNTIHTYLSCDCSVVQSAQALNYHRNTLQNQLKRITSIMGLSLDSPTLKSTLNFSCTVMKYFIEYKRMNIAD